ncbi:MAG: MFS transporter [Gammaproteobacteria bacterium]|nr:MFS transporter [Gammaproteobacteria bacterium]
MQNTSLKKPFSKDSQVEKSLTHSIKDGVAFSIMGGVSESYFSAYAIFLKASAPQVGLLASLPPLLASFSQLFAVWLGQVTGARSGIIVLGALLQVAGLICVALLPLLFPSATFSVLLACVIFYFIGPHLGSPLWGSLMGAIVPPQTRGQFFARRTRLSSIASFSALIIAGLLLGVFDYLSMTYYGFLAIFSIGVIARLISAWHLARIHDPHHEHAITGTPVMLFGRRFFKGQRLLIVQRFLCLHAVRRGGVRTLCGGLSPA